MGITIKLDSTTWGGLRYKIALVACENRVVSEETFQSIESWCKETLGPVGDPWDPAPARWYYNNSTFFFLKESDLTLFLIKWS